MCIRDSFKGGKAKPFSIFISNLGKFKKLPDLINQSNTYNTFFKILQKFNSNKYSYKPND